MAPKLIIPFTFLLLHSSISCSHTAQGARVIAMGKTTATATGLAAVYGNPAGITHTLKASASLGYATSPLSPDISSQSLAFFYPADRNSFAVGLQRYGLPEFYTLSAGFVYGRKFGEKLSIALRSNYESVSALNYGTLSGFSIDAGIMIVLTQKVLFGAYINNPGLQNYSSNNLNYEIPALWGIGASWQAAEKVMITAMLDKKIPGQPDFRAGLEYQPDKRFVLRGGASLHPACHFAGFGFSYRQLIFDFAVSSNIYTGYQPQLDLSYAW